MLAGAPAPPAPRPAWGCRKWEAGRLLTLALYQLPAASPAWAPTAPGRRVSSDSPGAWPGDTPPAHTHTPPLPRPPCSHPSLHLAVPRSPTLHPPSSLCFRVRLCPWEMLVGPPSPTPTPRVVCPPQKPKLPKASRVSGQGRAHRGQYILSRPPLGSRPCSHLLAPVSSHPFCTKPDTPSSGTLTPPTLRSFYQIPPTPWFSVTNDPRLVAFLPLLWPTVA